MKWRALRGLASAPERLMEPIRGKGRGRKQQQRGLLPHDGWRASSRVPGGYE